VFLLTNIYKLPDAVRSDGVPISKNVLKRHPELESGNAFCLSVHNLLSFSLLAKNIKIKIYRSIIFLLVLYGCETWSLTLREERRLRVFENRVLRRICGPNSDGVTEDWR
jgi:hypothetical protein